MPSTEDPDRPPEALAVARQYRKRERPLSILVAVAAVVILLGTFFATSLVPAVVVGAVLVGLLRTPLVRPHGTVRLHTETDVATVVKAFTGPAPPVLALQWGVADDLTTTEDAVTYHISYLLGLRSIELRVQTRTEPAPGGGHRVTLDLTADDSPWATYTATITEEGDRTRITCEYTADRRFGLRRVPQRLLAARYRDRTLAAQGYTVRERDEGYGI